MMVGRLFSYWEGNFSGSMLNFRGVRFGKFVGVKKIRGEEPQNPECFLEIGGFFPDEDQKAFL